MEIVYRKLKDIKPNPKNPRQSNGPDAIKELAESIKNNPKFFEARPILLSDRTGELVIIAGERRSEAAALLKMKTVPTILISGLTEAEEDEILIKDNTHSGKWDESKLAQWDKELLQGWNVDGVKWPKQEQAIKEDNFNPDKQVTARCIRGDLWQLGKHRLMCGDSTKREDVVKLTGGAKIDMCLTDPPYGMFLDTDFSTIHGSLKSIGRKNNTKGNKYEKVIGDNEDFKPELIQTIFDNFPNIKEIFLFGADYFAELLPDKNKGSWLCWDKRKESQADAIGSEFELIWSKNKHKRRMLRHDWFGFLSSENQKDARNRVHPTQKPVTLLVDILTQWGQETESVVDLYGGSGSILIACEQMQKQSFTMELDPHYCDVIIDRWEQFTGQKAKRIE